MLRFAFMLIAIGVAAAIWIRAERKLKDREFILFLIAIVVFLSLMIYAGLDQSGNSLT